MATRTANHDSTLSRNSAYSITTTGPLVHRAWGKYGLTSDLFEMFNTTREARKAALKLRDDRLKHGWTIA